MEERGGQEEGEARGRERLQAFRPPRGGEGRGGGKGEGRRACGRDDQCAAVENGDDHKRVASLLISLSLVPQVASLARSIAATPTLVSTGRLV